MADCIEQYAPVVTTEIKKPFAPWITDKIRSAMTVRNDLQSQLKFNRHNSVLQKQYKRERNKVKSLLQHAEQQYYREQFNNCRGNTAATWKVIRDIMPKQRSSVYNSSDDKTGYEKANIYNELFANIGKQTFEKTQYQSSILTNDIDEYQALTLENSFRPEPVDTSTVILTIKHLSKSNSAGWDGIKLGCLKNSLPVIIIYLTTIINTSIVTGVFPSARKRATVDPIFKSGDRCDAKNYRPISILQILSKILEMIVSKQLTSFLESHRLLSCNQHGFRPKLSTEIALTKVTNMLFKNMDEKKISLVTLGDLSKAFDRVNHKILLDKLSKVNVDSFWFKECLRGRPQEVKVNNTLSNIKQTTFGVPQGSLLGPILFTIFVNNLSETINDCEAVQYADDTQFIIIIVMAS